MKNRSILHGRVFLMIVKFSDVASLEVFIKPESKRIDELSPVFSVSENKGNDWLKHTVLIMYTPEPFQVSTTYCKHIRQVAIKTVIAVNKHGSKNH